jgi:hypothetical protein
MMLGITNTYWTAPDSGRAFSGSAVGVVAIPMSRRSGVVFRIARAETA